MATVTIKDIAQKLNVSPATVSLALNGRPGVNDETRRSVMETAQELGYHGSIAKKTTATQQGTITFLIYRRLGRILTNSQFFTRLIEAVEKAARKHHCTLTISYCNAQEELRSFIETAAANQSAGVLLLGTEMQQDDLPLLEHAPLPIVLLDCHLFGSKFDMVSIDNLDGVWNAASYLHAQGFTDIGYLKSSVPISNFEARYLGYTYSLKHFNLPVEQAKVYALEPTIEGAQKDMEALIQQGEKLPQALIADNDLIAIGALRALTENGTRVPADVAIIGFDNIPLAAYTWPPLSSIDVSSDELGHRAVKVLLWRLEHPHSIPLHLSISTKLILRDSAKKTIAK